MRKEYRNQSYLYPEDIDNSIRYIVDLTRHTHQFNITKMVTMNKLILRLRNYKFPRKAQKFIHLNNWEFYLDNNEVRTISLLLDRVSKDYPDHKDKLITHLLKEYYNERQKFLW